MVPYVPLILLYQSLPVLNQQFWTEKWYNVKMNDFCLEYLLYLIHHTMNSVIVSLRAWHNHFLSIFLLYSDIY